MNRFALPLLLAAGMTAAPLVHAGPSEKEKLRLLSCLPAGKMIKERQRAWDWYIKAVDLRTEGWPVLHGPLTLGGACIKDLKSGDYYGALMIEAKICNDSVEQFTAALGGIGIALRPDTEPGNPPGSLSHEGEQYYYRISPGRGGAPSRYMCALAKDAR